MLIDRHQKPWVILIAVFTALITVAYFFVSPSVVHPFFGASPLGITFGSLALAIMIFAALIGARKRFPALRVGRGSTWLKGHVWLTLLLIPLILFHSGFRWGGTFTNILWWLLIIVEITGILGIAIQQIIPRLLLESVPLETIYDQIEHIVSQLRYEADQLITAACGALGIEILVPEGVTAVKLKEGPVQDGSELLKNTYLNQIRPYLISVGKITDRFDTQSKIRAYFAQLKLTLPEALHATTLRVEEITEECRQLARQRKLHLVLHGWLLIHIPASFALLVLGSIHAILALWY